MIQVATSPAAASRAETRILLVDDDPIILDALSRFLRREGYTVETAADGAQAIEMLAAAPFALVLTDVNMPRANGLEVLRAVRQNHPDVVVIVITGYGTIENAVEAIKMGACDYLTKPVIDDDIRVAVEKAVKQQKLISENHQ